MSLHDYARSRGRFQTQNSLCPKTDLLFSVLHEWWTVFHSSLRDFGSVIHLSTGCPCILISSCSAAGGGTGVQLISEPIFPSGSGFVVSPGDFPAWKSHCLPGGGTEPSSVPQPLASPPPLAGSALACCFWEDWRDGHFPLQRVRLHGSEHPGLTLGSASIFSLLGN